MIDIFGMANKRRLRLFQHRLNRLIKDIQSAGKDPKGGHQAAAVMDKARRRNTSELQINSGLG